MLATRQAELESTNQRVEAEVRRQTERLDAVTQELVGTARRAGMAEIATGVLHNVGNALNSVNVSASVVMQRIQKSEISDLMRASNMLREHQDDLASFLASDSRGKHLPGFLIEMASCLKEEQSSILSELERVTGGIEHIKQVVGAQQKHAKEGTMLQKVNPAELFEQAITMNPQISSDSGLRIVRRFNFNESVALDKHKVLQILINLLSNANKAVKSSPAREKLIEVSVDRVEKIDGNRIRFQVHDNGIGIAAENLAKIFTHGFTTEEEGHGFGLHSAANAASEMNGHLSARSDGIGQGATFILDLPSDRPATAEHMTTRKSEVLCQRS